MVWERTSSSNSSTSYKQNIVGIYINRTHVFWLESTSTETIAGSNQHPRFNHTGNEGKLSWHAPSSIAMLDFSEGHVSCKWVLRKKELWFCIHYIWTKFSQRLTESDFLLLAWNQNGSPIGKDLHTNTTKPNKQFNIRQHVQWCRYNGSLLYWSLFSYSCLVDVKDFRCTLQKLNLSLYLPGDSKWPFWDG